MNAKLFALIGTTAVLLTFTVAVASTEAIPVSTSSDSSILLAQARRSPLNLTPEQQAQMRQIRQSTRTQIENILTPEQRNQWNAAMEQMRTNRGQRGQRGQSGQGDRGSQLGQMLSALNLTPEQKAQIQRISQESKQKMDAILTPEQRQQMQQMRQNRRQYQ
ncbi:hypothetical protein H6S82_20160 [Planktothrix sp. FACHB-1355]|uniref:P pilus assembly/Cpx signaling pathway, periplasmic inhibitor/zinc-resistance associated protein n=1 Tax=Aerosakkonema funiforme FACHB-1375 TaxID=2949571 RepID=A0A926VIF0_9CYAN|nr:MULTISPECIES: hypothetical protein [Oscillatoriales]MBD2183312.1 hypothetical protein [Aerosakkonema funiforme FACHB-1375]MBD3561147.1 hypothetical protein [Planktothrix sp. FACHB-1355]